LAGVGMLLGIVIFYVLRNTYAASEGLEITEAGKKKLVGPLSTVSVISIASLLLIPVCYFLIENNWLLNWLFLVLLVYVSWNLLSAGAKEGKIWRDRMIALIIFILINVVFWACFEQAGTSLTLFADRNVSRGILGWTMPASMTQFFNPFFIITFGSLFTMMWVKLSKIGRNPSIPMKFALGILQLGLGFLITMVGFKFADASFQVPLLTLVFLYMLHTTGELFLSPIGLSMVTKLAPKKIAGTAMGAWFLSYAIANLLGGQIAAMTGGGHGGSEEKVEGFSVETTLSEALVESGSTLTLDTWPQLDEDLPKNITLGKWMDVQDWVEIRESFDKGSSIDQWASSRSTNDTLATAQAWLNQSTWEDLSSRYKKIIAKDKVDTEAEVGLSMDDWMYYRDGMTEVDAGANARLAAGFEKHKMATLEAGLNNYTSIFSKIGFVLIAFSILIMLLNKPLKKLMHGVE